MRVLDDDKERRFRSLFRDEPERRESDQEQVRRVAVGDPKRRLEGASLGIGKEIETAEHWEQQLVEPREGEARLRESADRGHHRGAPVERPFL